MRNWTRPFEVGPGFYVSERCAPTAIALPDTRPRSARFVARLRWPRGFGARRVDSLWLSRDDACRAHVLWRERREEGRRVSRVVAYMKDAGPLDVSSAWILVQVAYHGECVEYGGIGAPNVVRAGLLGDRDLQTILELVGDEREEPPALPGAWGFPSRGAPTPDTPIHVHATGEDLDELLRAEVAMQFEGERLPHGSVHTLGARLLHAAMHMRRCSAALASPTGGPRRPPVPAPVAIAGAISALASLEGYLQEMPGRFDALWGVLIRLQDRAEAARKAAAEGT